MELQGFVQQLALHLTSWQATTFLIGEYADAEIRDNPVFTVADGLFWLYQMAERNSVVRKFQIMKLRGQASVPGLHTFRITNAGLQAFSRTLGMTKRTSRAVTRRRLSIGVPELDEMLGGGIPEGDSVLVAGASGTGKSVLAIQFLAEGIRQGEAGILSTVELEEPFTELPFSTYSISFLTDDIIRFRYVEIDGHLRNMMVVVKMRGGNHSKGYPRI